MFGLSFAEIAVVFIVALVVLGPEKLPEFARHFGKLTRTLKRQTDGLRREWYNAVYLPAQETKQFIEQSEQSLKNIGSQATAELRSVIDEDTCETCESTDSSKESTQEKELTEADGKMEGKPEAQS